MIGLGRTVCIQLVPSLKRVYLLLAQNISGSALCDRPSGDAGITLSVDCVLVCCCALAAKRRGIGHSWSAGNTALVEEIGVAIDAGDNRGGKAAIDCIDRGNLRGRVVSRRKGEAGGGGVKSDDVGIGVVRGGAVAI